MGLLIDLGILLIILLTTFLGYKRGFIKVAFKLLSFILALVIALLLYKPISDFILNAFLSNVKYFLATNKFSV